MRNKLLKSEGKDVRESDDHAHEDEDDRDTVRAPPSGVALRMREDDTLAVVMTPTAEAFRTSSGTITTPAPSRTRSVADRIRNAMLHRRVTARPSDTDETRSVKLDPVSLEAVHAESDINVRIPPLRVSHELNALVDSLSSTGDEAVDRPAAMQSPSPTDPARHEP